MEEKLIIIGASGHGKVVADIALAENRWSEIAFLDDNPHLKTSLGLEIIGNVEEAEKFIDEYKMIVAIGNNETRHLIQKRLRKAGARFPILIHPKSVIAKEVEIGVGTVIMAGVIINCSTVIGEGCIINTGSTIDHDNNIGNFVHVAPGAHLAGTVNVGEYTWIGLGSTVSNNLNITSGSIIGAGAVVVRNIIDKGTYIGIPATKI